MYEKHSKKYLDRIRWHCRRGMLELDIILQKFFDEQYLLLSITDQKIFEDLLACQDQELYSWLIGNKSPQDIALAKIVARILRRGAPLAHPSSA